MKFFILFILLFSCSNKPVSSSPPGEIMIYTSNLDKKIIFEDLNAIFDEYYYNTPSVENEFILKFKGHQDFLSYPYSANILLVSILEDSPDTTIDNLVNRYTEKYDTNNNILSIDDYYSMNQSIIILQADSKNELLNILSDNKSFIMNKYRTNTKTTIADNMYKAGKNFEIIDFVKEKYDISIPIQKDYTIINNSDSLLWIGRGYPYRWIVMYEDYKLYYSDKKSAYSRIESKTSNPLKIDYNDLRNKYFKKNINNIECRIIRTLYEHNSSGTGGPCIYYIYPINNSKVIVMGGFVNYPGHRKIDHIRQLEYIFENIELIGEKNE